MAGRVGLDRKLRIHFLQHCFNLGDPAVEEALYESMSVREFLGDELGHEPVPDETTICKFRHLLERHELGRQIFERVGAHLQAKGFRLSTGTIVDVTLRAATGEAHQPAPKPLRQLAEAPEEQGNRRSRTAAFDRFC